MFSEIHCGSEKSLLLWNTSLPFPTRTRIWVRGEMNPGTEFAYLKLALVHTQVPQEVFPDVPHSHPIPLQLASAPLKTIYSDKTIYFALKYIPQMSTQLLWIAAPRWVNGRSESLCYSSRTHIASKWWSKIQTLVYLTIEPSGLLSLSTRAYYFILDTHKQI